MHLVVLCNASGMKTDLRHARIVLYSFAAFYCKQAVILKHLSETIAGYKIYSETNERIL